ncbi:hypothetical protein D3C87_2136580 [compost metagenome]
MVAEVLVDEEGIKRRCIEAGQEHADDDQQIDLFGFNALCEVAVIVLEAVAIHAEIGLENGVVLGNRCA